MSSSEASWSGVGSDVGANKQRLRCWSKGSENLQQVNPARDNVCPCLEVQMERLEAPLKRQTDHLDCWGSDESFAAVRPLCEREGIASPGGLQLVMGNARAEHPRFGCTSSPIPPRPHTPASRQVNWLPPEKGPTRRLSRKGT